MTTRRDDAARAQLDRVHALLAGARVREVRMFGGIAVMVDDELAVSVHPDGDLLVRVEAEVLQDDDALRAWVGRATGYLAGRRQG